MQSKIKKSKVLIIYPPNQLMDVETPRPDGSLGPLYLAAELEKRGIPVDVLDASVGGKKQTLKDTFYRNARQENGLTRIGMNFDEIAGYVEDGKYNAIGISSNFTPQTRMAFETAEAIRKANPKIKIYAGGVNARALKERFLATENFDGVCLTEGELIFPRAILGGVENVLGWAYRTENGEIKINPVDETCFPKTLDELAMPFWEKLLFEKYADISSPHGVDVTDKIQRRYAPIMTSRGCPFRCSYCHISAEKTAEKGTGAIGAYRKHSIERVVEEMEKLKKLGIEKLFFEDDSLFFDKQRAKEIFERAKKYNFEIMDVNGVNIRDYFDLGKQKNGRYVIDREFLETLKNAGFEQIVFPVESGSQRILKKYATNKVNLDRMDLPELMKEMSELGIKAPVNLMIGFPDETEEEIQRSIELGRILMNSGAPYVTFFIPVPFPGSSLYDEAIRGGYLDRNFNPDLMNWKRPIMKNTIVPPQRLEEIRDAANDDINTDLHLRRRIESSVGGRWRAS
ncbi:B12-binding domain-containing radical SAM protein [Candidatus Pacearchaeota archaeon]|nr:B12-binding domain-containing radical SAM protein [Candidatus Pacearchaeota archaeon]